MSAGQLALLVPVGLAVLGLSWLITDRVQEWRRRTWNR